MGPVGPLRFSAVDGPSDDTILFGGGGGQPQLHCYVERKVQTQCDFALNAS